jgi:hypothetical protein
LKCFLIFKIIKVVVVVFYVESFRRMSKVGQKKLKWKPKPRPPPEPILVPPQEEKKIWEILREEKISPTKRYVRKRRIHQ